MKEVVTEILEQERINSAKEQAEREAVRRTEEESYRNFLSEVRYLFSFLPHSLRSRYTQAVLRTPTYVSFIKQTTAGAERYKAGQPSNFSTVHAKLHRNCTG